MTSDGLFRNRHACCLSAEHEAMASARVTAQCFGMGYGAGAACADRRRASSVRTPDLTSRDRPYNVM